MTAAEPSDDRPRIRLRDRGPAVVPLDLLVVRTTADWATRPFAVPDDPRGNVALCRCGQSGNKPFCDASHRGPDVEVEPDEADDVPDAAMADRPSGLGPCLALEDDGPVRLCGGIVVALPDGRVVEVADGTGLCRCGQSTIRPWCDGSHRSCGFTESG